MSQKPVSKSLGAQLAQKLNLAHDELAGVREDLERYADNKKALSASKIRELCERMFAKSTSTDDLLLLSRCRAGIDVRRLANKVLAMKNPSLDHLRLVQKWMNDVPVRFIDDPSFGAQLCSRIIAHAHRSSGDLWSIVRTDDKRLPKQRAAQAILNDFDGLLNVPLLVELARSLPHTAIVDQAFAKIKERKLVRELTNDELHYFVNACTDQGLQTTGRIAGSTLINRASVTLVQLRDVQTRVPSLREKAEKHRLNVRQEKKTEFWKDFFRHLGNRPTAEEQVLAVINEPNPPIALLVEKYGRLTPETRRSVRVLLRNRDENEALRKVEGEELMIEDLERDPNDDYEDLAFGQGEITE